MRSLVQFTLAALLMGGVVACNSSGSGSSGSAEDSSAAVTPESLNWKVGAQAYTFRNFTFFEAADKVKELGLHYIEAYPGQEIGGGVEGKMDFKMDSATQFKVLEHLKQDDVNLMAYGVVVPETEDEWKQLFVFAKTMGIQNIVSEPKPEHMDLVSKLCDEYGINVAIHNHPQPSHYWSPDVLLAAIEGKSNRIGSCADLGHWVRSGLDPVECLKKLQGHIIELHFKDVSEKGPHAEDTIWGTGVCNIPAVLAELQRQQFEGLFSIEYETHPENNIPQIQKSLEYFREEVGKLK